MKFKSSQFVSKDLVNSMLECKYFRERKAVCVELFSLMTRPVSTVCQVRVRFEDEERVYWIKISGEAKQEYRFLLSTYEQFRDVPQLTVVKPVAYLEDWTALITEHRNGELLSYRIKRYLNRLSALLGDCDRAKRDCYMCGKWLALLHACILPPTRQYNLEELVEYIDRRLELLVNRSGLGERFREQVLAYIRQILSTVPPEDLTRVKTHGDYAPYNILVSGNELVVLDPCVGGYFSQLDNYCSRYEDIVHFYNFLKGMSEQIVGSRTRKILVSCFLKGYNDNSRLGVDESSPAFKAFLVKYKLLAVLDSWPSVMGRLVGEKGRVRGFRRWFEKACAYE